LPSGGPEILKVQRGLSAADEIKCGRSFLSLWNQAGLCSKRCQLHDRNKRRAEKRAEAEKDWQTCAQRATA